MWYSSALAYPIRFVAAVERSVLNYGFSVFTADLIGNRTKLVMVGNMIFKLPSGAKGNAVYDNVIMQVIGIQMRRDDYLIIIAPHTLIL